MNKITDYAIADLHLHLDGALSSSTIIKIAKKEGINLPSYNASELKKFLIVPKNCQSLNEYLTCFDLPNLVLQSEYGLKETTVDLLKRLAKQGILYAEIRMAPQLSTKNGLSIDKVVKTIIKAQKEAERLYKIQSNLILCLLRGNNNKEANIETVKIAKKYLNKGVVAIDLAGAESLFANEMFVDEFKLAKSLNVPFTIHAGEANNSNSVKSALNMGACRIGHGIHSVEDNDLIDYLVSHKIPLEICLTSNLDTKAVTSINKLPIKYLLDKGVIVTINTDDPTVSNTSLKKEYKLLAKLGISLVDAKQIAINTINSAFLSDKKKAKLLKHIKNYA